MWCILASAHPRQFFTNRAARIYSVAVPAIILTWAVDYLGSIINPPYYGKFIHPQLLPTWVPFALAFLNDIWGAYVPIGSNNPYWTLGFEVWYYVLFGCALFAPRRWSIFGCIVMAMFLGPGIIILFPVWWAGTATYRVIGRISRTHEGFGWCLLLSSTILLIAFLYWHVYGNGTTIDQVHTGLAGDQPDFPRRYAVGMLFILHLVGFRLVDHRFSTFLHRCENPIRWMAGMTFSLYLYHFPLLEFVTAVLPGRPSGMIHRIGMICIPLLVIAGMAQITERKKSSWRRVIDAAISTGLANINRRRQHTDTGPERSLRATRADFP
jgi:peptidoglycan/LPS O-acetylase OafA/YrhL